MIRRSTCFAETGPSSGVSFYNTARLISERPHSRRSPVVRTVYSLMAMDTEGQAVFQAATLLTSRNRKPAVCLQDSVALNGRRQIRLERDWLTSKNVTGPSLPSGPATGNATMNGKSTAAAPPPPPGAYSSTSCRAERAQ
nr:uncharacterized protein LOC126548223 [Dermacentor andersoni]